MPTMENYQFSMTNYQQDGHRKMEIARVTIGNSAMTKGEMLNQVQHDIKVTQSVFISVNLCSSVVTNSLCPQWLNIGRF